MNRVKRILGLALLTCVSLLGTGCANETAKVSWGPMPAGADLRVNGKKIANDLLSRSVIESRAYGMIYPEVCVSYGSIRFAGATGDKALLDQLIARYQGMLNPVNERSPVPHEAPARGGGGRGRGQGRGGAATQPAVADGQAPTTQGARGGRGNRGAGGGGGAGANPQGVDPKTATALTLVPQADHVDASVFGTLPLEIYRQTKDERYLAIGKKSADDQWAKPDLTNASPEEKARVEALAKAGLTSQTRWWIDDMFMISAVQMAAYRATKNPVYLDHCATEMVANLDKLQRDNGLFYHADDVPAIWGRGCGWVAAGLTELLSEMPTDHKLYPRVMEGYKKMMAGLLKNQAPDGMWCQLVDKPETWPETSATGMFVFAMGTGVKKGWLPAAEYKEPAKKAWVALCSYLTEDGKVREVCSGTNKYGQMATAPEGMVPYYMDRQRRVGDLHGQAAFVWASYAMLD